MPENLGWGLKINIISFCFKFSKIADKRFCTFAMVLLNLEGLIHEALLFRNMHINEIGQTVKIDLKNIAYLRFSRLSKYSHVISPFTRMYFISEGYGHLFLEGKKIILEPDHLYLIPAFTPCTYVFQEKLAHYYIHFRLELPSGLNICQLYTISNKIPAGFLDRTLFERCVALNPGHELPHHDPKIYQKKPWANQETDYSSMGSFLETTGIIRQLFSRFIGSELTNNMHRLAQHNIRHILTHIQENLTNDLSIKELAAQACISKDHFTRLFRSITGIPPTEFIIRKRIEKAKLLLLTTNAPLSEITTRTGFKTSSYFCRIFKKYTSFTPAEFRRKRG